MDSRRAVGARRFKPWIGEGRLSLVALVTVVAVGVWPGWGLQALVLIAAGATLGAVVVAVLPSWSIGTCMRRGAVAGGWLFAMVWLAAARGLLDPDAVIDWAAAPPIGALIAVLSTRRTVPL